MSNILFFDAVCFLTGIFLIFLLKPQGRKEYKIFILALLFRILITVCYYCLSLTYFYPCDACAYYYQSPAFTFYKMPVSFLAPGTFFILRISSLLRSICSIFKDGYLMAYIPFSLLGFCGSVLFYKTLRNIGMPKTKLVYCVSFFMPNIIFWTSMIGKDAIAYFGLMGLLYALSEMKERHLTKYLIYIVFFGFCIYIVRPHIFGFILLSFIFGYCFSGNKFKLRNIAILVIALVAAYLTSEAIFNYVIKRGSPEKLISSLSDSEASISRFGPVRFWLMPWYGLYWLTSPYIWHAKKMIHWLAVFDAFLYQVISVYILLNIKRIIRDRNFQDKLSWFMYVVITSMALGTIYSNFGISIRQKIMVLPMLIIFSLIAVFKNKKEPYNLL